MSSSESRLWAKGRAPWYDWRTASPLQPFLIGVGGGSASGKTTVCREIVRRLASQWVQILSTDSFYRPLTPEERELAMADGYNFDHPNAFDWEGLCGVLKQIRKGKQARLPVYDFTTHSRRTETEAFYGADVVIVEGILALYEQRIREQCDMLIFVDTDSDLRLCRRIRRDIQERGRSVESVLNQYEKTVKPAYDEFIAPTKRHADIIIPRGGGNDVAISLLVEHVRGQLEKRLGHFRRDRAEKSPKFVSFDKVLDSPNLHLIPQTLRLKSMQTVIHDRQTSPQDFIETVDAYCDAIVENALSCLPFDPQIVETSAAGTFEGVSFSANICGVSITRSGDPLADSLRRYKEDVSLGKLVIQQLDSAKEAGPRLYYYKFPQELKEKHVLLFDAILASANAIIMGIRVLLDHECREDQILVCCMFASPEGLAAVLTVFPQVRVIVGCVEKGLDDNMHLVPGIGAFSARYYSHDLKEEDYVEAERKVPHV